MDIFEFTVCTIALKGWGENSGLSHLNVSNLSSSMSLVSNDPQLEIKTPSQGSQSCSWFCDWLLGVATLIYNGIYRFLAWSNVQRT